MSTRGGAASAAELVAKDAFSASARAYVASGLPFPDALAGSALAAAKHAPSTTIVATHIFTRSPAVALRFAISLAYLPDKIGMNPPFETHKRRLCPPKVSRGSFLSAASS